MFLAAAPYFSNRFAAHPWISANFQSSIQSVSTIFNLLSMLLLAQRQSSASYPFRITSALIINLGCFAVLAFSVLFLSGISEQWYFALLLAVVFITSCATGLLQNGCFAFAASFGHPSYVQAIMGGQGIAGVLPAIAQIGSVLAVPPKTSSGAENEGDGVTREMKISTTIYFLTAVLIAAVSLLAFIPLLRRHNRLLLSRMRASSTVEAAEQAHRKSVPMAVLYGKLPYFALAIILCFAVTMVFPVFTASIVSVRDPATSSRIFSREAFIPLAFLIWNIGDLLGRMSSVLPFAWGLETRPWLLFLLSLSRIAFIPLYYMCNIGGRGAIISSDVFYLLVVQFGFGLSNGWVASEVMMGATEVVGEEEREATGGFMGFNLVLGLTVGSLLSFTVGGL
jgi:equilibrative nucleoside transporter 1/2/3